MDQTLLPIRDPLSITTIQAKTSAGVTIKDSGGVTIATLAAAGDTDLVVAGTHAASSAGFHIHNASGQDTAIFGAGGGQGATFYGQINGTALVLSGAASCTTLTTSGNVGIGVTPGATLDVLAGATGRWRYSTDGTTGSYLDFLNAGASAWEKSTIRATQISLLVKASGAPTAGLVLTESSAAFAAGVSCTTLTASAIVACDASGAYATFRILADNAQQAELDFRNRSGNGILQYRPASSTDLRWYGIALGGDAMRLTELGALTTAAGITCTTLTVDAADYTYWGPSGTDGTWRMGRSGNDFVIQRRESGSYVTKQTIAA